jgi:hypothetical protein
VSQPEALLAAARHLLETQDAKTVGVWARAVAYLSRQALEAYLDALWLERAPGTEKTSMRAQLVCLPSYLGSEALARKVTYTWNALSQACHHRSYELAPTLNELTAWLEVIEKIGDRHDFLFE